MHTSLFLITLLTIGHCQAQEIKGSVMEAVTKKGIPYVNIGIPGKGIGTVTDSKGDFELMIPDKYSSDTLWFSCIGFESKDIPIHGIQVAVNSLRVEMEERVRELKEIVVEVSKLKKVELGSKTTARFLMSGLGPPDYGGEVGTRINVPRRGVVLDSLYFCVVHNSLDTVVLRLNLYPTKGKFPKSTLLKDNIIIKVMGRKKGWISMDVFEFNIELHMDVVATLELVAATSKKGSIMLSQAPPYLESMYYRKTSHDKIKVYRGAPMGIYFTAFRLN